MLVSVVMTVFNGEKYLQEAIDSVLSQTYKNFEFIIVNDGSRDNTKNILKQISDPRVNILHLEPNQSQANALNFGIDIAKGEWIARQDADDISLSNRLTEQVKFAQNHPHLIAFGSHIECFSDDQSVQKDFLDSVTNYHNSIYTEEDLLKERFHSCPFSHGSMMFSKEAFLKAGRYNPKYRISQDYDLWMRMYETGPVGILPKILYKYRILPNSLSQNDQSEFREELRGISVTYLLRMFSAKFDKHFPTFIILGSEWVTNFMKNRICPKTGLSVLDFVNGHDSKTFDSLVERVTGEEVDGIIVLDGKEANDCLNYLQNKGLEYNQNLFNIA
ncbi:MAG: glycosyltransferase [Bacillota bacterium]|nr:glycosyltransferase [Bacillota bacterium]